MARAVKLVEHSASYQKVHRRVSVFIRKYYLNRMLRGLFISLFVFLFLLLLLFLVNVITRSGTGFRQTAFFVVLLSGGISFFALAVIPFFRWAGLLPSMSMKAAESLIASNFPEMKDVLLNLIELGEKEVEEKESVLLLASIEEREQRLKWYRFDDAVPYRKLFIPALGFSALVITSASVWALWPEFIQNGYSRTVHYKQVFDAKIPLEVRLLNDSLRVGLGADLRLEAEFNQVLTDSGVYLNRGAGLYRMEGSGKNYSYLLEAINGPIDFTISQDDFRSEVFHVQVIPLPEKLNMTIRIDPPAHTNLVSRTQNNIGDLIIAEGSRVSWEILQQNSNLVQLEFETDTLANDRGESGVSFQKWIRKGDRYNLVLRSNQLQEPTVFSYTLEVVKDQFPSISANQMTDSVFAQQVYIQANIEDDYGFSDLRFFVYELGATEPVFTDTVGISGTSTFQKIYYAIDFSQIAPAGKEYEYFLSIWDNDGVNGPKRTDSRRFRKRLESSEEIWESNREKGAELGEKLTESQNLVNQLSEKLDDLIQSQLIENKEDWEIKTKVDEISDMKDLLEEMIDNIRDENQEINLSDSFTAEKRAEILKKQEQIEELFEKILDDELRELFEEFEKLAEEMNQKQRLEKTEELKLNLENLEQQLDVNLELLKKLEMEKQIYDLANKMKELGEQTKNVKDSADIEKSKEEFEQLEQKFEEQLSKNEELKKPHQLDPLKEEREAIKEELEKAGKEKDRKGKEEKMKQSGQKMEELGQKMQNMMSQSGQEGNSVDLELLRQLARELNDFSFKQEELLEQVREVNARNKIFQEVGLEQRDMELKFEVIRDSLRSLGYKQPMIASLLNEEVFHVETSLKNLFRSVQENQVSVVRYEQQKVMEGANELAVRLDELIQNIQAMSGQGEGESSFTDSKPKDGAEKMGEMREKQGALKEQLKGMIQKMKEGQKGQGGRKEMSKMLSERELLRQQLEQLRNSGLLGRPAQEKLNDIQNMMEEVEKDLIYDRVNEQTIAKEEWIQTRLLEAETAEKEREKDNKREATEFKGSMNPADLPGWKELEKERKNQNELLKYSELKLKEYYRIKYQEYLKNLSKKKN